jgi:hypothetical protein
MPVLMQKILIAVLAFAIVALSGALVVQNRKTHALEAQLAAAREESARAEDARIVEVARIQESNEVFKRESEQLRQKLADRTAPAADAAPATAAEKKEGPGDFVKGIAKMFTDPEMKKVMRSQQGVAIRMMYADLTKELGLTPDEATLVFDLLTERQMSVAGKAISAGTGEGNADAAAAEAKAAQDGFQAELRNILGDERMKKFEAFERTVGERMMLQQYQQSMTALGTALEKRQREGLLKIVTEERLKQPASVLDPGTKDVVGAMKAMRTGEGIERAIQQQRELGQRVLSRARTVLSADQTNAFEAAQSRCSRCRRWG